MLSLYTAFLALEVEQGGEICENCQDETDIEEDLIIATDEITLDSIATISASPNPFSEQTTLKISLGEKVDTEGLSFRIYDV